MNKNRMLVVGIDGACWPLIDEWIEEGILPNIKELKDGGVWGDMESCIPPITMPAWKCYSTGKNPGKLGVFWWEHLDLKNKKATVPDSTSFKSKEIWDYLNEEGLKTGVVGMPTTYPPKEINGFMISGGPQTPGNNFTYPRELEKKLKDKFDYSPNPPVFESIKDEERREEVVQENIEQIRKNFEICNYLQEKKNLDFLQVCSFHINGPLQHFFYNDEATRKAWKVIDEEIGKLREKFDWIIMHSDHGTSPMEKQFYLNAWLKKEGYLKLRKGGQSILAKLGITRENALKIAKKLHLENLLKRSDLIMSIGKKVPTKEGLFGEKEGNKTMKMVDWSKTKAVASAQGPIYLNKEILNEENIKKIKNEIIEKLEDFQDLETSKGPIAKVYSREDIYEGEYLQKAPDLIALDSNEYHNKGGIAKEELFGESEWKGNNSLNGLFLIYGKGIKENVRKDIKIYDLAPTILKIMDTSIPSGFDGETIEEIFK